MTAEYCLATFKTPKGGQSAGLVVGNRLYPLEHLFAGPALAVGELLKDWCAWHPRLEAAARRAPSHCNGRSLDDVELVSPVPQPGAFFCAGANYWDHLEEMAGFVERTTGKRPSMEKPPEPWFFIKTVGGTQVGHKGVVRLPSFSKAVDWEAELGVVIGLPGRNISISDALNHVAGYIVINDLSARDLLKREGSPFVYDWVGQKCFDDAAPMGPWLTPAAYVADPNALNIQLWLNGELKQSSNTARMVHSVAEQIAYLSQHVTLQSGDLIATGTPAGVGMPREEFLRLGDEVAIEIEGLGTLTNRMVADG